MSVFNDFEIDCIFAENFPFGVPNAYWITRQGRRVKISDMTSRHIQNCMRIVGVDDPWYAAFQEELHRRANDEHID